MKGASSYLARQVMGESFRWQGSYGAFTVSERGLDRVRDYVLNQVAHRRGGTTQPWLADTDG